MTAAETILRKAIVASRAEPVLDENGKAIKPAVDSVRWNGVQADLRNRAFFSSRVESARILFESRKIVADVAAGKLSESEARREMLKLLEKAGYAPPGGVAPDNAGDIRDLRSQRRQDAIIQMNVAQAEGYVSYVSSMDEGALMAVPCWELKRIEPRENHRPWSATWEKKGGHVYGGRMIALKTDSIWYEISEFGNPWPPFAWGSGMGVVDVSRKEAIALGVIKADEPVKPLDNDRSMNDNLEVEVPFNQYSPEWKNLESDFGSQIQIRGHYVRWNSTLVRDLLHGRTKVPAKLGKGILNEGLLEKIANPDLAKRIGESGLTITPEWIRTHGQKHKSPSKDAKNNIPLSDSDYELIPIMWRDPTSVVHGKLGDESDDPEYSMITLTFDTLDGNTLVLGVDPKRGSPTTFYKKRGTSIAGNPGDARWRKSTESTSHTLP